MFGVKILLHYNSKFRIMKLQWWYFLPYLCHLNSNEKVVKIPQFWLNCVKNIQVWVTEFHIFMFNSDGFIGAICIGKCTWTKSVNCFPSICLEIILNSEQVFFTKLLLLLICRFLKIQVQCCFLLLLSFWICRIGSYQVDFHGFLGFVYQSFPIYEDVSIFQVCVLIRTVFQWEFC